MNKGFLTQWRNGAKENLYYFRTYAVEHRGVVARCFSANAGQDAPPTMGVNSDHAPIRPINRATTT